MAADDHCGTCRYLGWLGRVKWCRHPDHPAALKKWPGKCAQWLHLETKDTALKVHLEPIKLEQAP